MRKPTHPGEVFLKDVLEPLNISITDAAKLLGITRKALSEFVNEMKLDRVGCFAYSREENTPAYDLPEQIEKEVALDKKVDTKETKETKETKASTKDK